VLGFHERLERGKINVAAAGRKMVARGKFHVVDMKARQPVGAFGQKLRRD
jgi:hypothetical protein